MDARAMIAFSIGVGAYSVGSTLYFSGLFRKPTPRLLLASRVALGLGALGHLWHIIWTSLVTHSCPIESVHFALSASALVMICVFLVSSRSLRVESLGAIVGPIALAFLIMAEFVTGSASAPRVPRFWLALHITANMLGVGLFLLAGAASAFYLYVERSLKQKSHLLMPGAMPALDALDLTAFRLLILGYPLLTFGAVTGGMFLSELDLRRSADVVRALFGYTSWLVLGLVLLWRGPFGNRGRKSALGTLLGVACVVLVLVLYLIESGATIQVARARGMGTAAPHQIAPPRGQAAS
jgi:ABC-type uncharacterized transport system permease subunit